MMELTVLEADGENLAFEISRQIARRGGGVSVSRATSPAEIASSGVDILVISAGAEMPSRPLCGKPHCGILLLPSGTGAAIADARCVVTYGMDPKSSLTLSSIGEAESVLALQRELVTAEGGVLDRQEFVVTSFGTADKLLAVSGALLLLGLPLSGELARV